MTEPESGGRVAFTPEQLRAIKARGRTVALSAGAGSGKTTVLVERFLDIVRSGCSPARILAITYTEKAAAEMKERIVRRFEADGDEPNRRAAEAAYISTIHGFCARLLRENALTAGLDPAFGIVNELLRGMFLDEQLETLYDDPWFLEALPLFRASGYDGARARSDTPPLFELICDTAFLPAEFGQGVPAEADFDVDQHVEAALQRADAYWEQRCNAARDSLIANRATLEGLTITGPKRSEQYSDFLRLVRALAPDSVIDPEWAAEFCETTGFTGSLRGEIGEHVRPVVKDARAVLAEFRSHDRDAEALREREHAAPLKVEIHRCARDLREAYTTWKRSENLLDFEDLQRRALALLSNATVRAEYSGAFQHILLDEAQDANDIQIDLVRALGAEEQELFAVGDVKQAIYGFRGANVALFQRLHAGAGEGKLSLVDNYRSRAEILGLVNAAGARMWAGDSQLQYEPLVPRLNYAADPVRSWVSLHMIEQQILPDPTAKSGERSEATDLVREREAVVIGAWIRDAVEGSNGSAPLQVLDPRSNTMRPVRYGDIAVLASSRKPFDWYERSLANLGIPFAKDGGRGFFIGREIQDLLALLRTLANPLDDVDLLATLRSPLFGWLDADLVRLRQAAGRDALWIGMEHFRPGEARSAADARATIETLRRWATLVAPCVLIEIACDLTAYRATLLRGPRGRAQVANIEKLMEFARASAMLDGNSLESFVRRAELAQRHLGAEGDAPVASNGDDVVTMSTIHGAKGLEWPVVILAALDSDFARGDRGSRYVAPDGALLLELKDPVTDEPLCFASNDVIKGAAKLRDEAEAKRLFYVAMTRTREHLVLAGRVAAKPRKSSTFGSPLVWLTSELGLAGGLTADQDCRLDGASVRAAWFTPQRVDALRDPDIAVEQRALAAARAAVRAGGSPPWELAGEPAVIGREAVARVLDAGMAVDPARVATTTVTRLAYFARCPLVYYHNLVLQVEEHPLRRGKVAAPAEAAKAALSALERGTLVHELLERADLVADPSAEASRLAAEPPNVAEAERSKLEAMLRRVLSDPLLDHARRATRLEREYPFYLDLAGTTIHGVIDLVFADEHGRGVVVDYKSNDLAAPDRVNVLTEQYRPQIELYALAARRAELVDPSEATLYFLNTAEARTRPVDERRLAVVEAETATMVASIARGAWDTQPGEKCRKCGYRKRGFCEVGKQFRE